MHTNRHRPMRLRFIQEPDDEPGGGSADSSGDQDPPENKGDADTDTPDDDKDGPEPFNADRALEKIRKLNSENRNLREAKKAAEDKAAGSDDKDKRITALEAEKLRIRIGYRNGLPDELIDRLQGTTEEEILADAEKLLGAITGSKKPDPSRRPKEALGGGSKPDTEPEETDPRKLAARVPRG